MPVHAFLRKRKLLLGFLKAFIAVGLVVNGWALAFHFYPPVLPATLALFGQVSVCPIPDAIRGGSQRYRLHRTTREIREQVRLIRTDSRGFRLWETPSGNFWTPDHTALAVLVAQQIEDDYGKGERGIEPGSVVLDCGAHVGVYTRKALDSGARLVVAIEPAPNNLECLRRNFAGEIETGRVVVCPKGVWDQVDVLPFFEDPNNSAADTFLDPEGRVAAESPIEVTTIDALVEDLKLTDVDRIKMDIKGAVERALRGAADTLARHKPVLVITTEEVQDDATRITRLVRNMGLGYEVGCGACFVGGWTLYPQVLFFEQRVKNNPEVRLSGIRKTAK